MAPADLERALRDRLVTLIDSASPTGQERAIADFVERSVRRLPAVVVERVGDNVVARPAATRGRPMVLLTGHLDTVPVQGNLPARVDDTRVHGLGASDLKAGLSVYLHL